MIVIDKKTGVIENRAVENRAVETALSLPDNMAAQSAAAKLIQKKSEELSALEEDYLEEFAVFWDSKILFPEVASLVYVESPESTEVLRTVELPSRPGKRTSLVVQNDEGDVSFQVIEKVTGSLAWRLCADIYLSEDIYADSEEILLLFEKIDQIFTEEFNGLACTFPFSGNQKMLSAGLAFQARVRKEVPGQHLQ